MVRIAPALGVLYGRRVLCFQGGRSALSVHAEKKKAGNPRLFPLAGAAPARCERLFVLTFFHGLALLVALTLLGAFGLRPFFSLCSRFGGRLRRLCRCRTLRRLGGGLERLRRLRRCRRLRLRRRSLRALPQGDEACAAKRGGSGEGQQSFHLLSPINTFSFPPPLN